MRALLDVGSAVLEVETAANASSSSDVAAVVLHPWGRLGGCMDDPTVDANFVAALRSGLFSSVTRYNQRCAGRSRGRPVTGGGDPDVRDLVSLCRHILSTPLDGRQADAAAAGQRQQRQQGAAAAPRTPRRLVLICYSYGSVVAAGALAQLPEVVAYVTIGFPLGLLSRWMLGSAARWDALSASPVPKLLIMGTSDNFTSIGTMRAAVARHDATPGAGPLEVTVVDGADHFLYRMWDDVADGVQRWLARQLRPQAAGRQQPQPQAG